MNNCGHKICKTIEPDLETKFSILKNITNTKFIDNEETINIGVVYHICYNNYNKTSADADVAHVTDILNKDFNKEANNFDNGSNIYSYTVPNIKMYKMLSYRKRRRYLRYTRRVRRNRRLYRRYRRINNSRRRYNRRLNRINRKRRRINKIRRRRNARKQRTLNAHIKKKNRIDNYNTIYTNYVNESGMANIRFNHIQTIYHPVSNITSDNLSTIDQVLKINGSPAVQSDKYLNVWIANLDNNLLGYAQFPWELSQRPNTDGIVISRYAFGLNPSYTNYDLNKTIIHEIGHWLGLYHTFQYSFNNQEGIFDNNEDNVISTGEATGDLINDTPLQNSPTYGDPYDNPNTWPSTKYRGRTYYHMYMNFMDYTDDRSMFMFTSEQCMKVRLMINHYRPNIINS